MYFLLLYVFQRGWCASLLNRRVSLLKSPVACLHSWSKCGSQKPMISGCPPAPQVGRGWSGVERRRRRCEELIDPQSVPSQQLAAPPVLALADLQGGSGGHLKHFPHAVLGLGRALQVAHSADPVGHVSALLRLYWLLQCLCIHK